VTAEWSSSGAQQKARDGKLTFVYSFLDIGLHIVYRDNAIIGEAEVEYKQQKNSAK